MTQALVPLKDLVEAKSRLSGLLRPSERRALAQGMAEDVLSVLREHAQVTRVTLLSDDPCAAMLAEKYAADCWPEAKLGCRGLNPLVASAVAELLRVSDEPVLVLHADLPMLAATDIDAALTARRECGGLVVGCDRASTGTNLLAFDARSVPVFAFGHYSCSRHLASARDAGVRGRLLRSRGIELDVDEVADLKQLLGLLPACPGENTVRLLRQTALGRRVEAALAGVPAYPGAAPRETAR